MSKLKAIIHGVGEKGWCLYRTPAGWVYRMPEGYEPINDTSNHELLAEGLTDAEALALVKLTRGINNND